MGQFARAASGTAARMGSAAVVSEGALATTSMFLTGVARANAALGVGILVFQGTSWIMIKASDDGAGGTEELVSDGWELSDIEYGEWEDAGTEQRWEEVAGSRGPCPDSDEPSHAIFVPGGEPVTPPAAAPSSPTKLKIGWRAALLLGGFGLLLLTLGGLWLGTSDSGTGDVESGEEPEVYEFTFPRWAGGPVLRRIHVR